MSVWCNACGKLSQDSEFCDHCNADLGTSGENLPPERCPLASDGVAVEPGATASAELSRKRRSCQAAEGRCLARPLDFAGGMESTRGWVLEKRLALQIAIVAGRAVRCIEDGHGRWLVFETVAGDA